MTEQTIMLKGEQWKQLALLSYTQLVTHLQGVPGNVESGEAGITDEGLALIDQHLAEARLFLRSWRAARVVQRVAPVEAKANGAVPKKRGRPRKVQQEAVQ